MNNRVIDFDAMKVFARDYLARTEPNINPGHNSWRNNAVGRWEHTQRVLATAQKIARAENADLDIVTVAAIFHDVAKLNSGADEHAARGARVAQEYLTKANFPADWIARVGEVIANHIRSDSSLPLEDRILRDADLLDELGALSIVWTAMNTGIEAPSYAEAYARIIKYDRLSAERVVARMTTPTGRAIAQRRLAFVNDFIAQLEDELANSSED